MLYDVWMARDRKSCFPRRFGAEQEPVPLVNAMRRRPHMSALWGDQTGQTSLEWALLLACFGLPMVYVLGMLLSVLAEHFRMVTFLESLPFP
jgi:hypothetical protein